MTVNGSERDGVDDIVLCDGCVSCKTGSMFKKYCSFLNLYILWLLRLPSLETLLKIFKTDPVHTVAVVAATI